MKFYWEAYDGRLFAFNQKYVHIDYLGIMGLFGNDYRLTMTQLAQGTNGIFTGTSIAPRHIDLNCYVHTPGESYLHLALTELNSLFNSLAGDGNFVVKAGLKTYKMPARYEGGLASAKAMDDGTVKSKLSFLATTPFFEDQEAVVVPFSGNLTVEEFFFPIFPFSLGQHYYHFATTINNVGSGDVWPIWDITSIGSWLSLRNLTTGKELRIQIGAAFNYTLHIDTRPFIKTITDFLGNNMYPYVDPTKNELWPLIPGPNLIEVDGVADSTSLSGTLTYYLRYACL